MPIETEREVGAYKYVQCSPMWPGPRKPLWYLIWTYHINIARQAGKAKISQQAYPYIGPSQWHIFYVRYISVCYMILK